MERGDRRISLWVEKMIFLDTSFIIALEVKEDQNHEKSVNINEKIIKGRFGDVYISDYVFDEVVTVTFGRSKDLKKSVLVGELLIASAKILKIDERIFGEAWELFKSQKDTKFSFTDCTNITLMNMYNIRNIATFDKDFLEIKDIDVISS